MISTTCTTCGGDGKIRKRVCRCWPGRSCPHEDDGKLIECPDCDGTGRKWCEICGDQPAIVAEKNEIEGRPPHLLCLVCLHEWIEENVRTRAEDEAKKLIKEMKG